MTALCKAIKSAFFGYLLLGKSQGLSDSSQSSFSLVTPPTEPPFLLVCPNDLFSSYSEYEDFCGIYESPDLAYFGDRDVTSDASYLGTWSSQLKKTIAKAKYVIQCTGSRALNRREDLVLNMIRNKDLEGLKFLKSCKIDISDFDDEVRSSLLQDAILSHSLEIVEFLFNYPLNVDLNQPLHPSGYPPLHMAVDGNCEVAEFLITKDPKIGNLAAWSSNTTPIFLAIYHNTKEMVELLIRNGADINHIDSEKGTPLDWAENTRKGDYDEKIKLLKKNGALRKHEL